MEGVRDDIKVTKETLQSRADDLQVQLDGLREAIRSLELNGGRLE